MWKKKANAKEALRTMQGIRNMMGDPSARFSISETLDTIAEIEATLRDSRQAVEVRAEIAFARGFLYQHQEEHEASIEHYRHALAFHAHQPFLPQDLVLSADASIAFSFGAIGLWKEAIDASQRVLPRAAASQLYDAHRIAGWRAQVAFWMHEAGEYEQARDLNLELITIGEDLYGDDSPQLMSVLTNIAQNHHSLGQPDEARPYLERTLAIAEANGDSIKVHEMLFQLGVLTFEQGHVTEAEALFNRGVDNAATTGLAVLIDDAQRNLEDFHARRNEPL